MDPLRRWWAPPCLGERRDASTRGPCPSAAACGLRAGGQDFSKRGVASDWVSAVDVDGRGSHAR